MSQEDNNFKKKEIKPSTEHSQEPSIKETGSPDTVDKKLLMNHSYDGIQEYDNPLPLWWLCTFIGTVIFAFHYYIHYEIGGAPNLKDELKISMEELQKNASATQLNFIVESEEELIEKMKELKTLSDGKNIYQAKCAACHGDQGQGVIGPNLTDQFWIHGDGSRKNIIATIRHGVSDKGMPGWETMLKQIELVQVTAYVHSLKGTNPKQPKAPQGVERIEVK